MTVSVAIPFSGTQASDHKASSSLKQTSSPKKKQAEQQISASDEAGTSEMQEVQNLPFESAKLKAQHFHWSERCSSGIQQMLTRRQQRHDAALQAYLTIRFIAPHNCAHAAHSVCCYDALDCILLGSWKPASRYAVKHVTQLLTCSMSCKQGTASSM